MRISKELHLYTDGACSLERGGFGFAVIHPESGKFVSSGAGPYKQTTNNQMEMMAVISGLNFVGQRFGSQNILILSDSEYVINGITSWIYKWKKNGWRTSSGGLVKNARLWEKMEDARNFHQITRFQWVKGHNGNKYNELVDEIAVKMKRRETKRALSLGTVV